MNEAELKAWLDKRGYILRCYRKLKTRSYISWKLKTGDLRGQLWIAIPIEQLPENKKFMETFVSLFPVEMKK